MDKIYYFSSPSDPAATAKVRPPRKTKPKPARKRQQKTGQMHSQFACVARIEEQWFCPAGPSTLFAAGSISYAAARTGISRQPTAPENCDEAMIDDADDCNDHDPDEENGGVSLLPYYGHQAVPGRTGTSQDEHVTMQRVASAEIGMTIDGRPRDSEVQTRQTREEEDGRRMRTALERDGFYRMHQPDASLTSLPHTWFNQFSNSRLEEDLPRSMPESTIRTQPMSSRTNDALSALAANAANDLPSTRDYQSARNPLEQHHAYQIHIDEDALAVDDPQRSYDFTDFLNTWRLRPSRDKRHVMPGPVERFSETPYQAAELITRSNVLSGDVDMQGISWQTIGCRREQATFARSVLHPSGVGFDVSDVQLSSNSSIAGQNERHYRFRSFAPQHKANFSHYQLRNALTASDRNDIFFANGSKVMRASLACPTQSETAMDLSRPMKTTPGFRITCLSASPRASFSPYQSDAVLLAGGFEGEFAVLNLSSTGGPQTEGMVTHAYNGLVTHIENYADRCSGLLRAAFCSNDSKVRLMDVRRLQFTDTFSYPTAINCSATSADGRLRALVGDSCETIITDAEKGSPLVTLRKHTDHGFACAWSQDGRNIATAAQDGKVVIWESRNWSEPLRVLDTSMSCARSLKFTDHGSLVVAENDDVIRIYDGGSFAAWQEIRFFGSIAGVALIDGGEEMVVANVDKSVGGLLSFERNAQRATAGDDDVQQPVSTRFGASFRRRRGRAVRQWDATEGIC